jgi:hypothetical protein
MPLLACLSLLASSHGACAEVHRYWPLVPRPKTLITVPFVGSHEEGMTFESAAGLAALASIEGHNRVLLYEDFAYSSYQTWMRMMLDVVKPTVDGPSDTWQAVARLRDLGMVRGYILFRYDTHDRPFHSLGEIDESANVATSLAPLLGGVAVSETFQPRAEELRLPLLLDVRDRTEQWCLNSYAGRFTTRGIMTAEPKSRVARSMAVAMRAFVVSRPGPVYEAALARCQPDCPVLGWGCGDEHANTMPSTEWGLFQTATNWCHNLPALAAERIGDRIPRERVTLPDRCRRSLADLRWETGVHYAAFLMSDGDNVQWLMGNFAGGSEGRWYYESPARGKFPFGWTFPYVDLAQLCPYTLIDLLDRATPRDDFVLYGGGYYYPDHFGSRRAAVVGAASAAMPSALPPSPSGRGDGGEGCLRLHARRLRAYMRLGGLRTLALNLDDWDSPEARAAYNVFAEEIPELDGILTVQYYPYSGGEGRILWATDGKRTIPVISCGLTIWANTGRPRDSTPAAVAKWLNDAPRSGPTWSDDHFTYAMAHSWSRFRDTHGDPSLTAEEEGVDQSRDAPDTARGLLPVKWCVDHVDEDVRVVTPTELLLLAKLHLRTRETLAAYLESLRPRAKRSAGARTLLADAEQRLPAVRDGDNSGRECFELLQQADRAAH